MNDTSRRLIQCVVENNLYGAKRYARDVLENNKVKSDKDFCDRMIKKMQDESLLEPPANIKGLLFVENPQETFKADRYYLSEREHSIVETILRMRGASQKLSEIGVNYVNSLILYGESGTGKTTLGKYIAYKLGLPFAYLNFSRVVDSYLGQTQKNISNIFDYVKQWKCVFMLDEVDAIGMERGSSKEVGELARIVISLMQNLDTLTNDTVLIGATNRIDIIDKALLRRFTLKHEVLRLTDHERIAMAEKFFTAVNFSITHQRILSIASDCVTQAELKNRMVMELVNHYMEDEDE